MLCQHLTYQASRLGSAATCMNCHQPIIFDGTKWRWEYELDRDLVRKLRAEYQTLRNISGAA